MVLGTAETRFAHRLIGTIGRLRDSHLHTRVFVSDFRFAYPLHSSEHQATYRGHDLTMHSAGSLPKQSAKRAFARSDRPAGHIRAFRGSLEIPRRQYGVCKTLPIRDP